MNICRVIAPVIWLSLVGFAPTAFAEQDAPVDPATLDGADGALPAFAYDGIARVSLVSTAAEICSGITARDRPLKSAAADVFKDLAAEGIDPTGSVLHFETDFAKYQINLRADQFRAKYGLGEVLDAAFCQAVKAEAKQDRSLRKLVKIKR